ncbi:unnamed protein product [Meloidogyne enterolobii]|uniref:Uncharacterized protein n=1 Tax=Meloidogyne enterolobii TaxID=390850 RepID=A0ACB1AWB1_MELEN
MDVEIGLISNKIEEKKKDAKISAKPGELSNSFKELGGETNDNIKV